MSQRVETSMSLEIYGAMEEIDLVGEVALAEAYSVSFDVDKNPSVSLDSLLIYGIEAFDNRGHKIKLTMDELVAAEEAIYKAIDFNELLAEE